MNIWLVSREYAGIAEAGGVKNVACSLCESLARLGHKITLFIPFYGCTDLSHVENCDPGKEDVFSDVTVSDNLERVFYFSGIMNGVNIVFVRHPFFTEKKAVYTYTHQDELEDPEHRQGEGHFDVNFLNTVFQKAVIQYGEKFCNDSLPDVIHCQDAATAMVPVYGHFSKTFEKTRYAVTIHNAGPGYHHNFASMESALYYTGIPKEYLENGLCGEAVEPFILAGMNACITTVSPEYAKEILEDKTDTAGLAGEFVNKKIPIVGITNGIDFSRYDTRDTEKSLLPFAYDPGNLELKGKYEGRTIFLREFASLENKKLPGGLVQYGNIDTAGKDDDFIFIAYHGRVVHQKGIEVMCDAAEKLLYKGLRVKFIFAGQGAPELEERLASMAKRFDGSIVYLKGYEKVSARLSVAAADFSLHPSWFEPCGLEDFIAQTFGTIPVAHATGGLKKIVDGKTGYLYSPNSADDLSKLLEKLILQVQKKGRKSFETMIRYASEYIHENYSWDKVALEYQKLYEQT
ncbi:glycogen synthase [Treponema sp.]|uniref:glycogen synthase n=1 Tax=Treponema sp. TaxID=166 RepID=UPI00388EA505